MCESMCEGAPPNPLILAQAPPPVSLQTQMKAVSSSGFRRICVRNATSVLGRFATVAVGVNTYGGVTSINSELQQPSTSASSQA